MLCNEVTRLTSQHILFDLDDTLIHCNRHFIITREKFLDTMVELFRGCAVDRTLIDDTQRQLDVLGVEKKGLGKHRFPESLVETYRLMSEKCERPLRKTEEEKIKELGYSVYDYEVEMYPDALRTLELLQKEGHELYLYTGGDFQIQTQKVLQAGLDIMFPEDRRFVFEHKNSMALRSVMRHTGLSARQTWMIGNSARNDIRPALELGLHVIHIPDAFGWEYDHVELDIPAKGHFHVLRSIRDVPGIIEQSVRGAAQRSKQLG